MNHQIRFLSGGLGVTANQKRRISSGLQFDYLFPSPEKTDPLIHKNGSTFDTIKFMKEIVRKTKGDTAKFARFMKKNNVQETLKALFDFMYNHIQYRQDDEGEEQLRRPSRAWFDRVRGVDCDCYSIFISSVLTNLEIPHSFRKTKYYGRSYFQHIYVIVPKFAGADLRDRQQYWVIDPVLDRFDDEKIFTAKHDLEVLKHKGMNGLGLGSIDGLPIRYMNGLNGNRSIQCKCVVKKGMDGNTYSVEGEEVYFSKDGAKLQQLHGNDILIENEGALFVPVQQLQGLGNVYGLGFFKKIFNVGKKIFKGVKKLFKVKKVSKVANVASSIPSAPTNQNGQQLKPLQLLRNVGGAAGTINTISTAFGLKNTPVGQAVSKMNAKVNQLSTELQQQKLLNQTMKSASADGRLDTKEILALVKASQTAGVKHDDMLKYIRSYSMKPEEVQKYADISSKRAAVAALAKGTTKAEAHKLAQLYAAEAASKTASKEDAQLLAKLYAEQAGAKKIDLAEAQRIAKAEAKANGISLSLSQQIAKLEAKAAMVGKASKTDVKEVAEQTAKIENAKTRLFIQKEMQKKELEERQRADSNKNLMILGGLATAAMVYMKMT